ncbi:MAG TPA: 6,7-dimethyl-8-ribityllumazine synthase [Candidatus Nanoarchaeia archaeon]|nr:6,7-dimethyl-8-ribityllumazine synthase [Candidatus Nanoarchaeia archaeon]
MKLGIVVSEFYGEDITGKMLAVSLQACQENNVEAEVIKVPGSFDIPLPVKKLLKRKDIAGVITLGAIIEGDTDHDGVIAYALAATLQNLSLEFEKPVVLGVNGPKMSWKQAVDRIPRARDVTEACIRMCRLP